MFKSKFVFALFAVATLSLSGCGGGGGDSGTTIAVTSFPLQAGYKARISAGSADNFSISGTCTGTANFTTGAAYPATPSNVAVVAAPVVKLAVPVQVPEIEKLSAEPADIRAL